MKKYKISNTEQCGEIGGYKIFICNRFLEIWGQSDRKRKGTSLQNILEKKGRWRGGVVRGEGMGRGAEQKFHQVFRYLY